MSEEEKLIDSLIFKHGDKIQSTCSEHRTPGKVRDFYTNINYPELFIYATSFGYMNISMPRFRQSYGYEYEKIIKLPDYLVLRTGGEKMTIHCKFPRGFDTIDDGYYMYVEYHNIWEEIKDRIPFINGISCIITEYILPMDFNHSRS